MICASLVLQSAVGLAAAAFLGLFGSATPTTTSATPSFDCLKAESSAEELICSDTELAKLDVEIARLFELARDGRHMTPERRDLLVASQRGWIKGRDDCWKAENLRDCVRGNQVIRIHELRQEYADARSADDLGISTGPEVLECAGFESLIGITFVMIDPPQVYLEWLQEFRIMELEPSGSGSKYSATHEEGETVLWIKGEDATLELPGRERLTCKFGVIG